MHGSNSTFPLKHPSYATFPNHEAVDKLPPKIIPPKKEQSEQKKSVESTGITDVENMLKAVREEFQILRDEFMAYDGKIAKLFAEHDSKVLQGLLLTNSLFYTEMVWSSFSLKTDQICLMNQI